MKICIPNTWMDKRIITLGFQLFPFFIILVLILNLNFSPPGPDSKLYYGLAENLLNGNYTDTVRGDEIMPSIGYPALVALAIRFNLSDLGFAKICIAIAFILLYKTFSFLSGRLLSFFFVVVFYFSLPTLSLWGIELGLLLSTAILFYSLVFLLKNQTVYSYLLLSASLLLTTLIRPLLTPFLYLTIPLTVFLFFKRTKYQREIFFCFLFFWGSIFLLGKFSIKKYGDKRLLSGTYSAIPLYAAWNKYIPLNQEYNSTIWNSLDENIRAEALAPLQNINGWQERDKTLKRKAFHFAVEFPLVAFQGYFWRLSKFTIATENSFYGTIVYLCFFLSLLVIINFTHIKQASQILFIIISGFTVYVIATTALFVFVGERYYLVPFLFLLLSTSIAIYILDSTNKSLFKIIPIQKMANLFCGEKICHLEKGCVIVDANKK